MQVTETYFDPTWVTGPADDADSGLALRSPGLHLSAVYDDIERTLGPKYNNFTQEELESYRAVGFLWERCVERAMVRSIEGVTMIRPGEVEKDGITGSPDLVEIATWTVVDTKATYRSSNKLAALEKFFWTWITQLKGYCHLLDTDRARLLVLFMCGDYAGPRPQFRRLDIKFSPNEIRDGWSMLVEHAKRRKWL